MSVALRTRFLHRLPQRQCVHMDTINPSVSGQPARLYRYSYSGGKYTLDKGFPTTINNNSSESMTIDEDSKGNIWATWTQVAGNPANGYTNTVYMNVATSGGTSWRTPFVLPAANPHAFTADISSVVTFGANTIGVMWADRYPPRHQCLHRRDHPAR